MAGDHLCVGVTDGEAAAAAAAAAFIPGGIQLAARREAEAEGAVGKQLRHAVQQSEGERRRTQEGQGEKGGGRLARDGAATDTGKYLIYRVWPFISIHFFKKLQIIERHVFLTGADQRPEIDSREHQEQRVHLGQNPKPPQRQRQQSGLSGHRTPPVFGLLSAGKSASEKSLIGR